MLHHVRLTFLILFCFFNYLTFGQSVLVSYGSNYAYYDNQQEPPAQGGDEWEDLAFDDNSWSTGNAHLGYGDGDETTTINSNTYTGYFRQEFNVSDHTLYSDIDLDLIYDDGAVVYLNGIEVWRVNMPGGTINYGTFASSNSGDNETASTNVSNSLVTGNNVLAVEVHQRTSGSSDLSFDFKLTGNVPGAVNVDRGPYLQKGTPTSMTVRWRTGSSTESVIDYGTTPGNLNMQVSDLTGKIEHIMEIPGLSPDTKYYYEISNSSAVLVPESTDLYFQTSPPAGTTQAVRAWILGDCGTANSNQRNVRDAYYSYVGSNHTDMILFLGDNAYNSGTDSEYQNAIFENMYENKLKNSVSYSCLGNHDGYSADSGTQTGPYYDIFTFPTAAEGGGTASGTEAYYSYDYANIHFIVLDAYDTNRSVGGTMYNWCLSDIQNTTQEWIVAIWHHPPYTKGSHDSDSESNLIDMRENFLPILEDNGVDLVLGGHSHSYERSYFINGHYGNSNSFDSNTHTVGATGDGDGQADGNGAYYKEITGPEAGDGAVYITTGSAGKTSGGSLDHEAMFSSLNLLGSCVLEVDGNSMDVKFIRDNGTIEDYFTIDKEASCTVGGSCDDGDPCTTNDVYDASCNCAGTFQDGDGDGVCDANDICPGSDDNADADADGVPDGCDICPGFDDNTDGDGDGVPDGCDSCPLDANDDSDGDGVCDSNDICPGSDDNADADGDGIPDGCDQCPAQDDALIGTSCDDGDPCTANDVYDTACNCAGTPTSDSDGDGVCDAADICPGFDDNADGDSDGVPNGCDICPGFDDNADGDSDGVPDGCDICPGFDDNVDGDGDGVPDGCDACPLDANDDSDGDGVCDSNDLCPGFDDNLDGDGDGVPDGCDICAGFDDNIDADGDLIPAGCDTDDNDPCVPNATSPACSSCTLINFENFESGWGLWYDGGSDARRSSSDASFAYSGNYPIRLRDNTSSSTMTTDNFDFTSYDEVKITFTYIANSMDNANEDFWLQISTNGGDSYATIEEWNKGDEFENGVRKFETVSYSGTFTNSTRFRFRCDASGNSDWVYLDDITIEACGSVSCTAGDPCNDNDPCTINDILDAQCGCSGTFSGDADGDGFCASEDPNDNDPCIPNANDPACGGNPCTLVNAESFETGYGTWNDGGSDCARSTSNAYAGAYSLRLRDNSSSSRAWSDPLDMSIYGNATIDFTFYPDQMENAEDFFLEVSTNGGSSYSLVKQWIAGSDFNNGTRYFESVVTSGVLLSNATVFRFRCDASSNSDYIYIDDIEIYGCGVPPLQDEEVDNRDQITIDNSTVTEKVAPLHVYPVPAMDYINIDLSAIAGSTANIVIYDRNGRTIKRMTIDEALLENQRIDISAFEEGLYFIKVVNSTLEYRVAKFIVGTRF